MKLISQILVDVSSGCLSLTRSIHPYNCSQYCNTYTNNISWYKCCSSDDCNDLAIPEGVANVAALQQIIGGLSESECLSMSGQNRPAFYVLQNLSLCFTFHSLNVPLS